MKIVFILLAVACLGLGAVGTVSDIIEGCFGEDTVMALLAMALLAGLFSYLAWLWRGKSPVKRAGEQAAIAVDRIKQNNEAYQELSATMKRRVWKYRIIGGAVTLLGVWVLVIGYGTALTVTLATLLLIAGIAIWMMSSPEDYNASTDMGAMIAMGRPRKIEEFYEAYKSVKTPLGSGWLGKFYTMRQTALIFGPDADGQFVYFWLTKNGEMGFIGYSFLSNLIKERINEPLIPAEEDFGENTAEHLCYHSDLMLFQSNLKENLEYFVKHGQVLPFHGTQPSEVYTFSEDFKLTGQRFELTDKDGIVIYEIEGTAPLINLYIYDTHHNEIFKMTKEIGHALATYRFYYKGELYGVFEKQFALVKDKFAMDTPSGKVELTEYAGSIGHNFSVTLNGKMLGAIVDNMDITIQNVVFDNAFIIVYDQSYLPLLTAMAVMVARELSRDQEGGITNWD